MRLRCGCGGATWPLVAYVATCSRVIGPDGANITSGTLVMRAKFKRPLIRSYARSALRTTRSSSRASAGRWWISNNDHEDVEIFCNHVAGATIVPRDFLLRSEHVAGTRGPTTWQDDVLRALARTFHASRETILRRLLTLNLATPAHYREKRRQFIAEYAQRAAQQPEGFAPHLRVQISGAGPLFTQLVVEAFNRERIAASDVSDVLSIRVKHLPEIERDLLRRLA